MYNRFSRSMPYSVEIEHGWGGEEFVIEHDDCTLDDTWEFLDRSGLGEWACDYYEPGVDYNDPCLIDEIVDDYILDSGHTFEGLTKHFPAPFNTSAAIVREAFKYALEEYDWCMRRFGFFNLDFCYEVFGTGLISCYVGRHEFDDAWR